jgi:transcriptional regulator with XRE-family HTH domain
MGVKPVVLTSRDQVAAVLRGRRLALGLTQDELNDKIGMTDGYMPKLEAPNRSYGRSVISETLFWWLKSLGLAIVVMDRAQAEALVASSTEPAIEAATHTSYPGRTESRTPIRRTRLTTQITWIRAA